MRLFRTLIEIAAAIFVIICLLIMALFGVNLKGKDKYYYED